MALFGGIPIHNWQGHIQPLVPIVKTAHRYGSTGNIIESYGLIAQQSTLQLLYFASNYNEAEEFFKKIIALVGTVTDATDDFGKFYSRVAVTSLINKRIIYTGINSNSGVCAGYPYFAYATINVILQEDETVIPDTTE